MRRNLWLAVAGVATAALCGACDKKPASTAGAARGNAADTYRTVREALGRPLLDAVRSNQGADSMLAEHEADIDRLVEATRSPDCDFGIDYSSGLATELTHLSEVRDLARVLKADAARRLAAGDADAAAQRVAAVLRLAAQTAQDAQTIIEMLTACAVARLGADFVNENPGLARAAWKTDIQQALAEIEADGLLNSAACVRRDGEMVVRALRAGGTGDLPGGRKWAAASQAERDAAAAKLEAINAEAVAAWNAPDAAARLQALSDRAAREGVGELVTAFLMVRKPLDDLAAACRKADATLSK